jgi:hypothetical protein
LLLSLFFSLLLLLPAYSVSDNMTLSEIVHISNLIIDKLTKDYPTNSWADKLFVHAPFSLWHGWIVYSAVINLFQAFTTVKDDGPSVWIRILVILAFVFLTSTAIGYVEYKKQKGDVTGALVIGLGLLAIFTNQHDPWIHWSALVATIITLIYPARPYVFKLVGRDSNAENAPLLG